jgi:presenilin-like A22 family membrane protease
MALALSLALYVATKESVFFPQQNITSPDVSLAPVVIYFFGVVAVMAVVLFFIPLRWLKYVFKLLFTFMFAWGSFWVVFMHFPANEIIAYVAAGIAGIAWLFFARIWLHDLLLLVALAGAGSVFGFMFSPLTFMIFMLIIAVYDVLAVRFGFMVWMADKMSESTTLPAFIFPKKMKDWLLGLKTVDVGELKEKESAEREYAILGGGDIGFPLMLAVSVFFDADMASAIVVGGFATVGLALAFLLQIWWLKGKPMPALPPIAALSLVGFVITRVFMG